MQKNIELIFLRHAQSQANIGVKDEGFHPDDPRLSDLGEKQALLLAERFAPGDISAVYASSLLRTCQTVEPTAKKLGLKVRVLRELMEVDTGVPNASPDMIKNLAPCAYDGILKVAGEDVVFPLLNQNDAECVRRSQYCVDRITEECDDGDKILICTHGAFLGYLIRYSLGLSLPEKFNWEIDNCCMFRIKQYSDRIPKLIASNDGAHLYSLNK